MEQVGGDDAQFRTLMQELSALALRQMPLLLIWDARGTLPPTPTQGAMAADLIKRHRATARQHCIAVVFVVDSQALRGAVAANLWGVKPPFPVEVVNDRDELAACLRAYVAREKLPQALVERFLGAL